MRRERSRSITNYVHEHKLRKRTKIFLGILFLVLIVGWVATAGFLQTEISSVSNKPIEKACPILENATATANVTVNKTTSAFSIYYFNETGCPFCAQENPIIQNISKSRDVTTINLTTDPNGLALSKKYNVTTTPTIVIFKDNKEIKRFAAVTSQNDILNAEK